MTMSDKIMFEIYRETGYTGEFRVVYFTELNDRNKESEINAAMAGEHYLDGFIPEQRKEEAKLRIGELLKKLNAGANISTLDALSMLFPYVRD
jgi:hypothetical protein